MHPGVQARFGSQGGLITREQALDLGITPSTIAGLVNSKQWIWIRRGVYADAEVWADLDDYRGRPLLRARAASLQMKRGWVLSHDSSAHALGLDILEPGEPFVHVTRPGFSSAWTRYGVKHHYARFRHGQVVVVDGMRCLDMARTAIDIAREHGTIAGVVACDAALRAGMPRARLIEAHLPMENWPFVTRPRAAVDLADGGAQNPAESMGRMLLRELDIGEPDTQFPVHTAKGVFWGDIRIGNHIFEVHGKLKYRPVERGGVAERPIEDVVWAEKERQTLVCSEGLGMSSIVWADFWGQRRSEAKRRLRAEYAVTLDRFGPDPAPHLARNAVEIRARHGA